MFWVSAFVDVPAADFESSVEFWSAVTGWKPSARRGEDEEFLSLVPPEGDDHVRMQRVGDGPARIHLDLHVTDPRTEADRAISLGASEVADHGYVVMRSPGGMTFCFVSHAASRVAAATRSPDGSRSIVDQVVLDIPEASYDDESGFWRALLGWPARPTGYADFELLPAPEGQPLRVLLQRVHDDGAARAHLDVACTSRDRELLRHVGLGARMVTELDSWTVMADPAGMAYCLLDRPPRH